MRILYRSLHGDFHDQLARVQTDVILRSVQIKELAELLRIQQGLKEEIEQHIAENDREISELEAEIQDTSDRQDGATQRFNQLISRMAQLRREIHQGIIYGMGLPNITKHFLISPTVSSE
jgi:chromosome segregation ATPase